MKSLILMLAVLGQWETQPAFQPSKVLVIQDRATFAVTIMGDIQGDTYSLSGKLGCSHPHHAPPKQFGPIRLEKLSTESSLNYRGGTTLGLAPKMDNCEARFSLERISPKKIILTASHSHGDQGHIFPLTGDIELLVDRKIIKISLREQINFAGEFTLTKPPDSCIDARNNLVCLFRSEDSNEGSAYNLGSWPIRGGSGIKISFDYRREENVKTLIRLKANQYSDLGDLTYPDTRLEPIYIIPTDKKGYWHHFEKVVPVSPKADNFNLILDVVDGTGVVWFDKIKVTAYPEPRTP